MTFTPRFSLPEKGNPYYNTKSAGGYSTAIEGKPNVNGLNVLANCVGWAHGRFHEIAGDKTMSLLKPVNAELFIDYADKSLKVGTEPKLGAVLVWQRGATKKGDDGCGHVAIVEQINSDGSIITSESGWNNSKIFWTTERNNKNGRWGEGSAYKFLGFIYQPNEIKPSDIVTPPKTDDKPKVGDIITTAKDYKGYKTAEDAISGKYSNIIYKKGRYHIYKIYMNDKGKIAYNISRTGMIPGAWVVL